MFIHFLDESPARRAKRRRMALVPGLWSPPCSPAAGARDTPPVQLGPPAAGDSTIKILPPTFIELELVQAKPPDPAVLPAWNFVGAGFPLSAPNPNQFNVLAG